MKWHREFTLPITLKWLLADEKQNAFFSSPPLLARLYFLFLGSLFSFCTKHVGITLHTMQSSHHSSLNYINVDWMNTWPDRILIEIIAANLIPLIFLCFVNKQPISSFVSVHISILPYVSITLTALDLVSFYGFMLTCGRGLDSLDWLDFL